MTTATEPGPGPPARSRRVRAGTVLLLAAVLGAACGFDPDDDDGVDFSAAGPFAVGSATIRSEAGARIEILYPATDSPGSREEPAAGAEPADAGPFPLVLSTDRPVDRIVRELAHLASWGLVVAAPARQGPDGLADAIDVLTRATIERDGPLEGVIDTEQVALRGRDVLDFAADPQVDVLVIPRPAPLDPTAERPDAGYPPSVIIDEDAPSDAERHPLYDHLDAPQRLVLWSPDAPVGEQRRIVDHVAVAQLRAELGPERDPAVAALSPEALSTLFGSRVAGVGSRT